MATLTLEMPATAAPSTDSQKFRITFIGIGSDKYSIKYQLLDGIDWLKPRAYELSAFTLQTVTHLERLTQAIKRVYETDDRWSDADLLIDSLKLTYAGEDDKGDKRNGIQPRPEGALAKVAIASSYQSSFVYGKTPWLPLGAFEQFVDGERESHPGFLNKVELSALQEICNNVSQELARELNKPPAFKPQQLKLL